MFCTHCGNSINKNDLFCTKCGNLMMSKQEEAIVKNPKDNLDENWWVRLLKVLYIILHLPLLIIIPIVWSSNTESCYYYICSGSTSEAFWYSLLTLIIYILIVRLIKLATMYVAIGRKPNWKKEFKKFF